MKRKFLLVIYLIISIATSAQSLEKDIFAFTITDYLVNNNDSISIVQVELSNPLIKITDKQLGLLKHNFSNNNEDTASIGHGRCNLIKGSYYYFGIRLYKNSIKPMKNDIVYTKISYPTKYKGQFYNLIRNAVYFEHVTGGNFFDFGSALEMDERKERNLIDSLVADIKFTGEEMQKKSDSQDAMIEEGLFKGKKLFACMQTISAENVKDFIDYVIARPSKYAGNTWKIAEVFATWVMAGTPRVVK